MYFKMSISLPWVITTTLSNPKEKLFFLFDAKSFNPELERNNKPYVNTSLILPMFKSEAQALEFNVHDRLFFNTNNIVIKTMKNNIANDIKCSKSIDPPMFFKDFETNKNEIISVRDVESELLKLALFNNVEFFYVDNCAHEPSTLTLNGILFDPLEYVDNDNILFMENMFIDYLNEMFLM